MIFIGAALCTDRLRATNEQSPEMAKQYVTGYGHLDVIQPLKQKFVMPFGFGRLWWAIRTSDIPGQVLRRRVEAFHRILLQNM
jgi:hypothetical protein